MSVAEFIVSLVEALAWPIAVLILAFTFRADLVVLLQRLSSLKHRDTELQFRHDLAKAAEAVEEEASGKLEYLETPEAKKVMALLEIDPKSAVIAAWVEFEAAARDALPVETESSKRPKPMPQVIQTLLSIGRLDESDSNFLGHLRQLRNALLHSSDYVLEPELASKASMALLVLAWELRGNDGHEESAEV